MKEIKYDDATVIKTRTVTRYAVAMLLPRGATLNDYILYETYEDAKRITEGMVAYHRRHGDEASARECEYSAYCIFPVEVPYPVIDWEAAKSELAEEAAGKREVA